MLIERADVVENHRLDACCDLDAMSFDEVQCILVGFIKDVLIAESELSKLGVSNEMIETVKHCVAISEQFNQNATSGAEIKAEYSGLWAVHDRLQGIDKAAIRLLICVFTQKETSMFDEYGGGMAIGTYVSLSYQLGGEYLCKKFGHYIESHPNTHKLVQDNQGLTLTTKPAHACKSPPK